MRPSASSRFASAASLKGDPDARVSHVATIERADAGVDHVPRESALQALSCADARGGGRARSQVRRRMPGRGSAVANPYATYARIASVLHPTPSCRRWAACDARSSIRLHASIRSASIGANVVIEAKRRSGARAVIGPGSVVMSGASDRRRYAVHCQCHDLCRRHRRRALHLSSRRRRSAPTASASRRTAARGSKFPRSAACAIGNDVEIGANSTIDRGAIEDTVIGDGVKLDNQIHIAHNVQHRRAYGHGRRSRASPAARRSGSAA